MNNIKENKELVKYLSGFWIRKRQIEFKQCVEKKKSDLKKKKLIKKSFSLLVGATEAFGKSSGRYLEPYQSVNDNISISVVSFYHVFRRGYIEGKKEIRITLILNTREGHFWVSLNKRKEVGLIGIKKATEKFLIEKMTGIYKRVISEEKKSPGSVYIECW